MNGYERHKLRQHFAEHGIPVEFGEKVIPQVKADAPRGGATDLLKLLILTKEGMPRAILANALLMLRYHPLWFGVLAYNQFSLYTVTKKPAPWQDSWGMNWTDNDDSLTAEWLQRAGVLVNSKVAAEAVQTVARENPFHPVENYLSGLKWDGEPRIDQWLTTYLGAEGTPFTRAIGARWLISAVARIFRPGCQVDHVLLLEGPQGIRKSTTLRVLAGDDWFCDHVSELGSKDSRIELHGKWILEMSEMDRVRRGELERVKAFLTARSDHFRPPYSRRAEDVPRQCVFAASVNDETSLTDETGNRRFWPVGCGAINIDLLRRDRDQLWAETVERHRQGEAWWLNTEELNQAAAREQDARYDAGVWDDIILAWVDDPKQRHDGALAIEPFDSIHDRITVTDVLIHAIGKDIDRCIQGDRNQVVKCLTHDGWKRKQERSRGPLRGKWYYRRVAAK